MSNNMKYDFTTKRNDQLPNPLADNVNAINQSSWYLKRFNEPFGGTGKPYTTTDEDGTQTHDSNTILQRLNDTLQSSSDFATLNEELKQVYQQATQFPSDNQFSFNNQIACDILTSHKQLLPIPKRVEYSVEQDLMKPLKKYLRWGSTEAAWSDTRDALIGLTLDQPISETALIIGVKNQDTLQKIVDNAIAYANTQTNVPVKVTNTLNKLKKVPEELEDKTDKFMLPVAFPNIDINEDVVSAQSFLLHELNNNKGNIVVPTNIKRMIQFDNILFINLKTMTNGTVNTRHFRFQLTSNNILFNRINRIRETISLKELSTGEELEERTKFNQPRQSKEYVRSKHENGYQSNRNGIQTNDSTQYIRKWMKNRIFKEISRIETENRKVTEKRTFMRASRRDPDDINLKGSMRKMKYYPNIHIWLDTSGSISQRQYSGAIQILVDTAKALNVNIILNSFADAVSESTTVKAQNKSKRQIYNALIDVPKISGGTIFEKVYEEIEATEEQNKREHKGKEIHFMITDFEYDLRSSFNFEGFPNVTKNMFYIPMLTDESNDYVIERNNLLIEDFAESAENKGDKSIKRRIAASIK